MTLEPLDLGLVLVSALMHAGWNLIAKIGGDRLVAIAVIKVPNGHMAWVVTPDGQAERRDLVVGQWFGKEWIIDKGLGPDDKVVVAGMQRLAPGMQVNATLAEEATPSAAAGAAQTTGR